MNAWVISLAIYLGLAAITFIPTLLALTGPVRLNPGGPSFDDSPHFSGESKTRLEQHDRRIHGTLGFWKKQAAVYGRFHNYVIGWTVPSSIVIPILTQVTDGTAESKLLLTVISATTELLLAFHRTFKVDSTFRAFRQGESDFYDRRRQLLDRPKSLGATEEEQVENFFQEVETIRRLVRSAEIDNFPSVEDIKSPQSTHPQ